MKKSIANIKHDNEIATNLVRTFIGRPVAGAGALAGGAVGLGVGAPVGIASLFFGGGKPMVSGSGAGILGTPFAIAAPVVTTGVGGAAGYGIGRGVGEGVTQVVGGVLGGVASILLAVPRRIHSAVKSNHGNQEAEHRRALEEQRNEEARRADQQLRENRRRAEEERVHQEEVQRFRAVQQHHAEQQQSSSYSYSSQAVARPSAPPARTELETFLNERQQYNNRKRLYQALFDLDSMAETDPNFVAVQQEIFPFFQNKIGQRFEEYQNAIQCPIEMDVPNDPITIPSDGPERHMMGHEMLKQSTPNYLWNNRQYKNPLSRSEGAHGEIEPAYATQSLIERLIVRSYEFRELRETAKGDANAHVNAIKRYHAYMNTRPTNQARLETALAGNGTLNEFLEFFVAHDSFNATFAEHAETVKVLITALQQSDSLPKMPVIKNGVLCDYDQNSNPSEISIVYDVQNVIEQVLLAAKILGPDFVNSKNQALTL